MRKSAMSDPQNFLLPVVFFEIIELRAAVAISNKAIFPIANCNIILEEGWNSPLRCGPPRINGRNDFPKLSLRGATLSV